MEATQHIQEAHKKLAIKREKTVDREEFLDYITFKRNDRLLFREIFGPLIGLKEEWKKQGATEKEIDFSAFNFREAIYYNIGAPTGYFGPNQSHIIEETDEYIIYYDFRGTKQKLIKKSSTLPLPMEHLVENFEDWKNIKKFYEFSEERLQNIDYEEIEKKRKEGYVICCSIPGGFDEPRVLMGDELAAISTYTQPELVKDILDTIGDTALRVLEEVTKNTKIDMLMVHEDMAGKSGPMWGPKQVDEFMKPYFLKIWNFLKTQGTRAFHMDSDGNMNPILDNIINAGINFLHPCEPAAGMDVVEIRKKYGKKIALEGGINKFTLLKSKEEITKELEYIIPNMIKSGGYVAALDHRIPKEVSLENYKFYYNKLWEITNREENKK